MTAFTQHMTLAGSRGSWACGDVRVNDVSIERAHGYQPKPRRWRSRPLTS